MYQLEADETAAINQYHKRKQKLKNMLIVLQEANESDLTKVYQCDVFPCMDTDKQMREAYWKYYSDEDITQFGLTASIEFNRTNNDGTADEIQFKHLFPEMFDYTNPLAHDWTRADVRKFVEGVPNSILISIGY